MSEAKKLLDSISEQSDEHEFYTPIPKGYKPGKTKYIIVFGTVMSGLGKGIFSSSLGKLLKFKGVKVSPIKLEGYLNVDSGTLNPFRHGEVFVLDDGLETDMDLGTYERMLDENLNKNNYSTNGRILTKVLAREREGKYLGRDVQIIPHVTGEIKLELRNLAMKSNADVVLVEIGGTVGDLENMFYIEAMRQLAYEEGKENVCFVALTFIMEPKILGEQKSKAAQLGVKRLMETGIQPDLIACRASSKVTEKVMEKISIYTNVPMQRVFSLHDEKSIYLIPKLLKNNNIDKEVTDLLKLKTDINKEKLAEWEEYVKKTLEEKKKITIGITGKYTTIRDSYASIIHALEHAGTYNNVEVRIKWIETTEIENNNLDIEQALKDIDGVIVPGGFGKRGVEGKIKCIKYIRENKIPYLGLCYGFQMALVEFARNVCNLKDAHTTEVNPKTKHPVITYLPEQMKIEGLGGNMRLGGHNIDIKENTFANKMYGKTTARERFRHRYECNPEYIKTFEKHGIVFSGKAPNQPIMQILELPDHPFFIGTQAHPEFTSRPLAPNPFYREFVKACLNRKQ